MSERYYKDKLGKKDRHLAVDAANIILETEISQEQENERSRKSAVKRTPSDADERIAGANIG